jgi:Lrp/AsnC family transcriptional regulator, leucine-responsive regulatory protein
MPPGLDEIDVKLLAELEADADRSNVELAKAIGLSAAATFNRVKRLKESGIVTGIAARLDSAALGFNLQVYVEVTLGRHDDTTHKRLEDAVGEMPQVIYADWVTGEVDALLMVVARNIGELQRVLLLLSSRGGAQRVVTLLRLQELKPASPLPLAVDPDAPVRRRRRAGTVST